MAKAVKVVQDGQIDAARLKRLVDGWEKTKDEVAELTQDLGAEVRDAIENHRLHRRAFRTVMTEYKMEPERLAAYYESLDFYREALGLVTRAESAPTFNVIEGGKDAAV